MAKMGKASAEIFIAEVWEGLIDQAFSDFMGRSEDFMLAIALVQDVEYFTEQVCEQQQA